MGPGASISERTGRARAKTDELKQSRLFNAVLRGIDVRGVAVGAAGVGNARARPRVAGGGVPGGGADRGRWDGDGTARQGRGPGPYGRAEDPRAGPGRGHGAPRAGRL